MKKIKQIKELFEAGKEKQAKDMLGHLLNDSTNQCFVCTRWIYRTMCGGPENGIAGAAAVFKLMQKNKSAEIFGRVYELEDDLFSHIGFHKWAREVFKKLIKASTTKEEFFVVANEAERYIKREIKTALILQRDRRPNFKKRSSEDNPAKKQMLLRKTRT